MIELDPIIAAIIAVLGVATGIFGSHATLGNKITRALTLLEDLTRRVGVVEDDTAGYHRHRRAGDMKS